MSENLVACEFEDSTNCIWNAQEQGNGTGQSFVDIDGSTHYVTDTTVYEDVWVDGWLSFPYKYVMGEENGDELMVIIWEGESTLSCPENKVPGWLDENGNPQGCVDNNPTPLEPKELPVLEEVPEVVVEVPVIVDPVPEELANTGTGDVVVGVLVGLALLVAGVVLFIRGRKNK